MYIAVVKLYVQQTFVRIHNLFQGNAFIAMEYKRRLSVIVFIKLPVVLLCHSICCFCVDAGKDASRKITSQWYKVNLRLRTGYPLQVLPDLCQMLMREQFVYGYVVAPVTEMCSLARLLASSCRSGNGCDVDFVFDESCRGQRQHCKLDRRSEAAGVCHIVSLADFLAGTFAQSIYELPSGIVSVEPEVITQVYDPAVRTDLMAVHKLP